MDKILNYTFSFLLIYLFIVEGHADDHLQIIVAFLLSLTVTAVAFFLNWVTIDVLFSGTVFGTVVFGLGGFIVALPLLIFFVSGSMLTVNRELSGRNHSNYFKPDPANDYRRNGTQVWSNGFWIALCVTLWFMSDVDLFLIMSLTALSTATADTWATEIGQRKGVPTYLTTTLKPVSPGTEGGISFRGLAGAMAGSATIGLCYVLLTTGHGLWFMLIISVCGFAGAFVDSILGSFLQRGTLFRLTWISKNLHSEEKANNTINFIATGSGSLFAALLTLIM